MSELEGARGRSRVFEKYLEILNEGDPDRLSEVLTADYIQVIPQSGEVIRGLENFQAVLRNWPGDSLPGSAVDAPHFMGAETDYTIARPGLLPFMSLVQVETYGETLTSYSRSTYPDGSVWYVTIFATLRGDKIAKEIYFFAPLFEAPEWRLPFVHVIPRDDKEALDRVLSD